MSDMPCSPQKKLKTKVCDIKESEECTNVVEPDDWEEVEVDIGWGTLRGKARGCGSHLVLGLHGWLDNANTFDLVANVIPKTVRFISLDLPGHGLSDHFPQGYVYDPRGYMVAIKKAVVKMGWKNFTLLGHSMGAVVGILYTAVFPEDVHAFISIDIIKTWSYSEQKHATHLNKYIMQYFDNETMAAQPALVYTKEQLVQKVIDGSKSLDERGAKILLKRGAKPSECGKGLILTRDMRAKTYFIGFHSLDVWLAKARSINCPILIIMATEGHSYETQEGTQDMLKAFEEGNKNYRYREVEGKHHIHLTNPSAVGRCLKEFLMECTDVGKAMAENGSTP